VLPLASCWQLLFLKPLSFCSQFKSVCLLKFIGRKAEHPASHEFQARKMVYLACPESNKYTGILLVVVVVVVVVGWIGAG
jgi:hypothetical protein